MAHLLGSAVQLLYQLLYQHQPSKRPAIEKRFTLAHRLPCRLLAEVAVLLATVRTSVQADPVNIGVLLCCIALPAWKCVMAPSSSYQLPDEVADG